MNKLLKLLSTLDWVMGAGSIALGIYWNNYWLVAGGVLGLFAAYYKPAMLIKNLLEKKFLRKNTGSSDTQKALAEDEFYAQMLQDEVSPVTASVSTPEGQAGPVNYGRSWQAGVVLLSGSRHNVLSVATLNLVVAPGAKRTWA